MDRESWYRDLCRIETGLANDDDDDGCLRNSFVTWIPAGAREEIHRARARNKLEKVVSRVVVVVVVSFFLLQHWSTSQQVTCKTGWHFCKTAEENGDRAEVFLVYRWILGTKINGLG